MTNNPLSPDDIKNLLDVVKADKDARRVFLAMTREDQLLALLGMIAFNNNQIANVLQEQKTQKDEQVLFRNELREVRTRRELLETQLAERLSVDIVQTSDPTLTTTQKVKAVITAQYGGVFKFFMDISKGILQTILTIITLAILYLSFGGKLPVP